MLNVTRGQLVPYTITYNNITQVPLFDVTHRRSLPGRLQLRRGLGAPRRRAGRADGRRVASCSWSDLSVDGRRTAHASCCCSPSAPASARASSSTARRRCIGLTGNALSGEATATVRVVPDPTFDCTDVTGKVFDDANRNGLQDDGERGLSGVRVVSARGLDGDHGRLRALPHHLRDHAARRPRQQLRAEARRSHAAERLPRVDGSASRCSARRAVRRCASTSALRSIA